MIPFIRNGLSTYYYMIVLIILGLTPIFIHCIHYSLSDAASCLPLWPLA